MLVGPTVRLGTPVVSSIRLTGLLLSRPSKAQADVDVEASPFILRSFPRFKSEEAQIVAFMTTGIRNRPLCHPGGLMKQPRPKLDLDYVPPRATGNYGSPTPTT